MFVGFPVFILGKLVGVMFMTRLICVQFVWLLLLGWVKVSEACVVLDSLELTRKKVSENPVQVPQ